MSFQFSAQLTRDGVTRPIWEWLARGKDITAIGSLWKPGWHFGVLALYTAKRYKQYHVGQSHAVMYQHGKPAVWYRQAANKFQFAHQQSSGFYHPLTYEQVAQQKGKEWLSGNHFIPLRIRITSLEKIDVRRMTDEQAQRTGFASTGDYLAWWFTQYDGMYKDGFEVDITGRFIEHAYDEGLYSVNNLANQLYTALFVGFETEAHNG